VALCVHLSRTVTSEVAYEATEALQRLTWKRALIAFGVLLAFYLGAKLVGFLVRRGLSRAHDWGGPVFALSKLLSYFLVFIGLVTALTLIGVPLSSLLLTSSALLVGIGFSLQHVVRDFVAGIVLLVEQPIRKGDFVNFGDTAGTVREIGLRATHLRTRDGTDLVVPNHLLVSTQVYNHSHPLERARLTVAVPVSLHEDVDLVEAVLLRVAREHPQVLREPAPLVRLDEIVDAHFLFSLVVWVQQASTTLLVSSELRFGIAHAFAQMGVRFPTRELELRTRAAEPRAAERPAPT
jgi:small-conductance mechanosensitive channel